jgi:hypothetical protein
MLRHLVPIALLIASCASPPEGKPPASPPETSSGPREGNGSEEHYPVPEGWVVPASPDAGTPPARMSAPPVATPKSAPKATEPRPDRRPRSGEGREGRPSREKMLDRFDADGDGVLSEEERQAAREARGPRNP